MEHNDLLQKPLDATTQAVTATCLVERSPSPGGLRLVNPKAVARHSSGDLVALAQEIQKADDFVRATASNKLEVIVEQVRHLQNMARKILQEAKESAKLHHAACNFRKVPGHTYHLYRRASNQLYFSMLSPNDWGSSPKPHEFLGSYRLEHDMTWTPAENVRERDAQLDVVHHLLQFGDVPSDTLQILPQGTNEEH